MRQPHAGPTGTAGPLRKIKDFSSGKGLSALWNLPQQIIIKYDI